MKGYVSRRKRSVLVSFVGMLLVVPFVQLAANSAPADLVVGSTPCSFGTPTHTTITAALVAATSGMTVGVCGGTFAESITITTSVTLVGEGQGVTRLAGSAPCATATSGTAGVTVAANNVTISNLGVSGFFDGIDVTGPGLRTDVTLRSLTSSANCRDGIRTSANPGTSRLVIDQVTSTGNDIDATSNAGRGFINTNGLATDAQVTNGTFSNNRLVGIDFNASYAPVTPTISGGVISGNVVEGNGDSGIAVALAQNTTVSGNTVRSTSARFGIEVKSAFNTTISGNTVRGDQGGAPGVVISGINRDRAGIASARINLGLTDPEPNQVAITNNTVSGFVQADPLFEGYGILAEGTTSITGNVVTGNQIGIQVQEDNAGNQNTVSSPWFGRGNSVSANVTITGNAICANTVFGIRRLPLTASQLAEGNWWAQIDGAGPTGSGDRLSFDTDPLVTNVDAIPFIARTGTCGPIPPEPTTTTTTTTTTVATTTVATATTTTAPLDPTPSNVVLLVPPTTLAPSTTAVTTTRVTTTRVTSPSDTTSPPVVRQVSPIPSSIQPIQVEQEPIALTGPPHLLTMISVATLLVAVGISTLPRPERPKR